MKGQQSPQPNMDSLDSRAGSPVLPHIPNNIGLPLAGFPHRTTDTEIALFFLECDHRKLDALLETDANQLSAGHTALRCVGRELGGKALCVLALSQATMQRRRAGDGKLFGKERVAQLDFLIPCIDQGAAERNPDQAGRIGLYLPFSFSDSATSVATGRELFGFSRYLANLHFEQQHWSGRDPRFSASLFGFEELGPERIGQERTLLALPAAPPGPVQERVWHTGAQVVDGISGHFLGRHWVEPGSGRLLAPVASSFLHECMVLTQKQFPAIENSRRAHSTQQMGYPLSVQRFRAGGTWLGPDLTPASFALHLPRMDSHPVADVLGLTLAQPTGGQAPAVAMAQACWLSLDFGLEPGVDLAGSQDVLQDSHKESHQDSHKESHQEQVP